MDVDCRDDTLYSTYTRLAIQVCQNSVDDNVIILEDAPELPSYAHALCLLKKRPYCAVKWAGVANRFERFFTFREKVKNDYPEIMWINPRRAICDKDQCVTDLHGIPLYRDERHLNLLGSRVIGKEYMKRFGVPPEL